MSITRRARAAALAGALLAASAGVLSASTLAADASVGPPNSTLLSHHCVGLGNDGTTRGVACADLLSVPDGSHTEYFGRNEVYCQNLRTRAYARCAGITETPAIGGDYFSFVNGIRNDDNFTFSGGQQECGAILHHSACAVGETVHVAVENGSFLAPSGDPNVVSCSFHGESVRTSVRLPGSLKSVGIHVLASASHNVPNC
ncbi:MAG: hypothetical protein J2P32_10195 [Actinobacteria bacterium]|nr:hypothetical protein [Actinomycetota bacterium]